MRTVSAVVRGVQISQQTNVPTRCVGSKFHQSLCDRVMLLSLAYKSLCVIFRMDALHPRAGTTKHEHAQAHSKCRFLRTICCTHSLPCVFKTSFPHATRLPSLTTQHRENAKLFGHIASVVGVVLQPSSHHKLPLLSEFLPSQRLPPFFPSYQ